MADISVVARDLTGGQIHAAMDTLLYAALLPVVESTDLFNAQLGYVLSMLVNNKKRKPCSLKPAEHAPFYLVQAIHAERQDKMQYIRKLRMERSFIYMFLQRVLDTYYDPFMRSYSAMLEAYTKGDAGEFRRHRDRVDMHTRSVGAESRNAMYHMLVRVRRALPEFKRFFDGIVSNFTNMCFQQAQEYVRKNPGRQYDVDDVAQNFLRGVIVGLNKYDSSRGAHTSYIKWWLFNAQTCGSSEHEYGIAYHIPQSQVKRLAGGKSNTSSNFSVSLDQNPANDDDDDGSSLHSRIGGESQDLEREIGLRRQARRIAEVAKAVDPYGIWRLTADIDEVFGPDEIQRMREHMATQNL